MPAFRSALLLSTLLLGGCVVHVKDSDVNEREASWQRAERDNRDAIAALSLGMHIDDVRSRLGSPAFSEAFHGQRGEHRVLFYRTQRVHADGMTTREETTPLVFFEGKLTGWGSRAWAELTDRPLSGKF